MGMMSHVVLVTSIKQRIGFAESPHALSLAGLTTSIKRCTGFDESAYALSPLIGDVGFFLPLSIIPKGENG
jgi:hypothetical protein